MFRIKHNKGKFAVTSILLSSVMLGNIYAGELTTGCYCKNKANFEISTIADKRSHTCSLPKKASNSSWLSWLSGNSRSTQFHFLDLLELMNKGKAKEPAELVKPQS